MRIAVCDNDEKIQDWMKQTIKRYFQNKNRQSEVFCFGSGEALLKAENHFDVIFLDIEMENLNGMETAAEIRKTDTDVEIIILSGYAKYKSIAYDFHVFHYLDKPVHEEKIFHVLNELERYHENKQEADYLTFRSGQNILKLKKNDILYIEHIQRVTWLFTRDEAYAINSTIIELNERLESRDFYQPHRSYLVNLNHVSKYTALSITLDDKKETLIPVSQLKSKEFKKIMLDFLDRMAD